MELTLYLEIIKPSPNNSASYSPKFMKIRPLLSVSAHLSEYPLGNENKLCLIYIIDFIFIGSGTYAWYFMNMMSEYMNTLTKQDRT